MIKKPELLAPAGDLERLKWAIHYGADAVYLGGPALGLRANAKNFTIEEIQEGCTFAHERGKRVYVTVNIVLHNEEAQQVKSYLKTLEDIGVDAIIISDPAIIKMAHESTTLELHLSTQQSTLNRKACQFWYQQGVKRIVLARETTMQGIQQMIQNVPIEIECFIHGAMCAGVSGRCVLSNFLTGRDANRGGCSQICRWDFVLQEDGKPLVGEKDFTLCSKDLSMLRYLPEMINLSICSFKIEGRMRSIYYIATVVDIYRRAIDQYCNNPASYQYNEKWEYILRRCANRDSVPQFFDGRNDETMGYYNGREEVSNQDFLGVVLEYDPQKGCALLEERNFFALGDVVEFFGPQKEIQKQILEEIYDEEGNSLEIVRHPKQRVWVKVGGPVSTFDLMRKSVDKTIFS